MNKISNSRIVLLCIVGMFIIGCSGNANKSGEDTVRVDYKFNTGAPLNAKDWHCYNVDEDRICIPSKWNEKKQSKFLLFSYLETVDSNAYFVVLRYNKTTSGLTVDKYLRGTYDQLKNDSAEIFTGYTLKKITFKDKESYYAEYYTDIKHKSYMTYSSVFEVDDSLFEIALKVDSSKADGYKNTYRDILFNFQHKQEPIFSAKDEITNVQVIDLSKNE